MYECWLNILDLESLGPEVAYRSAIVERYCPSVDQVSMTNK